MKKSKKPQSRGYISKFLKTADKAMIQGIKDVDIAIHEGIKKADKALDAGIEIGIITAKQARLETKRLRNQAEKEVRVLQDQTQKEINLLQKRAEQQAEQLLNQSNKEINKRVKKLKQSSSRQENLRVLSKLAQLKKAGVITQKEFLQKKKHLLKEIQSDF